MRALLRPELQGATPYGAPQLDVPVALNTNESAYPVPPVVVDQIAHDVAQVAATLNRYPDREFARLRELLASYLTKTSGEHVTADQVWAANGSNEVLQHLVQAFGGAGRTALGFTPSYSMHPLIAGRGGATWIDGLRDADPKRFDLDADLAVEQTKQHDPDLIFLTSPNNPTGTSIDLDVVRRVYDASDHAIVVVDEAYTEFARTGTRSALTLLPGRDRLVVSRTMSKAFAFAGARLGYFAAATELAELMRLVRLPYHLSSVTQAVACAALEHADTMLAMVERIKTTRDALVDGCLELGLQPVPSDANFVLVGGFADSATAWQALLDEGVLVRDVGIPHHLRITAGTAEENTAVLQALRTVTAAGRTSTTKGNA
nr:histidinol-phosphate transaminase [Flexivirga aerilata]